MLLMCKNVPVYDIDNEKILNTSLFGMEVKHLPDRRLRHFMWEVRCRRSGNRMESCTNMVIFLCNYNVLNFAENVVFP